MHFDGTVQIMAPRQKVWDFLTDPEAVSQCAPGLRSMEVVVPGEKFRAQVSVGFGSMKVNFDAEISWQDLEPLDRASIIAHATAPGSVVDVTSEMRLVEMAGADDGSPATEMHWTADIQVSGRIRAMASRLMGSVTKQLTRVFFNCVKNKIEV